MAGIERFNIKFVHLKPGRYTYDFEIGEDFFENFEYSLINKASIKVHCLMVKEKETLLHFRFFLEGSMHLTCDRCLDEFDMPVYMEEKLMVKITDHEEITSEEEEQAEDLVLLPTDAIYFNVAKPVFDYLNLAKPMKPACDYVNKACNKEMIDILNNMQKQQKENDDIDPRWEELKKFLNKNSN